MKKPGTTYESNRACKLGHTERYVKTNQCVSCTIENAKRSYRKRLEKNPNLNKEHNQKRVAKTENYYKIDYQRYAQKYKDKARRRTRKLDERSFEHERQQLLEIYQNCPEGCEVDHDIPISHPLVCGLHCVANLSYLTTEANRKKSNNWIQK